MVAHGGHRGTPGDEARRRLPFAIKAGDSAAMIPMALGITFERDPL